jgi:mono/diheme cytochrome c family protein
MAKIRTWWVVALAGLALLLPASRAVSTNLVFDGMTKEFVAKQGDRTAEFDFSVTNTGPEVVTISSVRASCGCTTPKLPALPWKLEPGTNGTFHVTTDLAGKFGTFQKSVFMDTSEGPKIVYVKITMPPPTDAVSAVPGMDSRTRNMQIAHADPQAIFRGDCANCHAKPTLGRKGEELFTTACGICHESDQRAVLVPDLHALKQTPTDLYWDAWIRNGKVGTMMPAFSLEKHGPLSDEQIDSLVAYLTTDFAKRTPRRQTTAAAVHLKPPGARAAARIELPGNLPQLAPAPEPPQAATPSPIRPPGN